MIKKIVKKIIGVNNIIKIKNYIKFLKINIVNRKKTKTYINDDLCEKIEVIDQEKYNIFNGYYDLNPVNKNYVLVHKLRKNAKLTDSIDICYYDIEKKSYTKIDSVKAWSWQQGSRLRWSNLESNCVYYNKECNDHYCTKKVNITTGETVDSYDMAFYDISFDEKYGISVNFDRLQRLRAGYGYSCFEDKTINDNAPKDDGIFYVDMNTKKSKLLMSVYDLAKRTDPELKYQHYINHISISPNGEKIMFFHIWNIADMRLKTEFCVIDKDGNNLISLEKNDIVSHYDWISNEQILVTVIVENTTRCEYRIYDITTNKYCVIDKENLSRDGHPTMITSDNNVFVSDTYPNENGVQELFIYDIKNKNNKRILSLYSDVLNYDQKRCDLHPKISFDEKKLILIDSTYKKRLRSVIIVYLKENNYE